MNHTVFPFPFKNRWSSSVKPHTKGGSDSKTHRKNSNPMSNFTSMPPQSTGNCCTVSSKQSKSSYGSTNYYPPSTTGYNKSSSYPNFNSSGGIQHGSQHHSYHRHSVSNLITITPSQTTASIVTTPSTLHLHHQQKSASAAITFIAPKTKPAISTSQKPSMPMTINESTLAMATKLSQNNNNNSTSNANLNSATGRSHSFGGVANQQMLNANVTSDLSSDREFFIRQIAEQAIN